MSRRCELTGAGVFSGNKVSHSNIKTRTRWLPNVKNKKFFIPELSRAVTLTLTARAIRTIDKQGGITPAILKAKDDKMSPRLAQLKRAIIKTRTA
jgi:large subunit ribosomal protein L28